MSKIIETNQQYYQGAQGFRSDGTANFTCDTTFNTDLIFGSYDPTNENYAKNNFKIYFGILGKKYGLFKIFEIIRIILF